MTQDKTASIKRRVSQSLGELSETERAILTLWREGDTLSTIAKKTGISIDATRRILTKLQRKIVDEVLKEIDEIVEEIQCDREQTDRLKEETRSNISELQRMIAA